MPPPLPPLLPYVVHQVMRYYAYMTAAENKFLHVYYARVMEALVSAAESSHCQG